MAQNKPVSLGAIQFVVVHTQCSPLAAVKPFACNTYIACLSSAAADLFAGRYRNHLL
jgi:hypothetical protein